MKQDINTQFQSSLQKNLSLRPKCLDDYIGQKPICKQLRVFIQAAIARKESLDHTLLFGSPGLGKTTLAMIIAAEMGSQLHITTGPALERAGDIAALMTGLNDNDVLFIDEIHRLHPAIEETMYSALEDFRLDIVIGEGSGARAVKLDLPKFTLIGATTRAGRLTAPLRDRFGIVCNLEFYNHSDMEEITRRSSRILGVQVNDDAIKIIAHRARRTPRIANRLLRRTRDFAQVEGDGVISQAIAQSALTTLGVDTAGLDSTDLRYTRALLERFGGGPVGLETLAMAIGESTDTLESFIEPYLLKEGFITRQPRGRVATAQLYLHMGLPAPSTPIFDNTD